MFFVFIGTTWTHFTFYIKNAFHMLSTEWNFLRNWSIMEMRLLWKSVLCSQQYIAGQYKCYSVMLCGDGDCWPVCVLLWPPQNKGPVVTMLPRPTRTRQSLICFPRHFDFWFSFVVKMWTADMTECFWLRGWLRLRGILIQ